MSFIRVTQQGEAKKKIDVNSVHIVSFEEHAKGGSSIDLITTDVLHVVESTRQLRSFIKKAQGTLPVKATVPEASE